MAHKSKIIRWNERPQRQLKELLVYIIENYSSGAADKFLSKIEIKLQQIRDYPEAGQLTRYKSVRRLRIDKYHSLSHSRKKNFYRFYLG